MKNDVAIRMPGPYLELCVTKVSVDGPVESIRFELGRIEAQKLAGELLARCSVGRKSVDLSSGGALIPANSIGREVPRRRNASVKLLQGVVMLRK